MAIWALAWRLQSDSLGGVQKEPPLTLGVDPVEQEADIKSAALIVPPATLLLRSLHSLFFVPFAAPLAIAVWRWWAGQDADVDWRQVFANTGALVLLAAFWIKISRLNRETVASLRQKVEERKKPHAGQ